MDIGSSLRNWLTEHGYNVVLYKNNSIVLKISDGYVGIRILDTGIIAKSFPITDSVLFRLDWSSPTFFDDLERYIDE